MYIFIVSAAIFKMTKSKKSPLKMPEYLKMFGSWRELLNILRDILYFSFGVLFCL